MSIDEIKTNKTIHTLTSEHLIQPQWPVPRSIQAFTTTRQPGLSEQPYASFNLAGHTGDDKQSVAANRQLLAQYLGDNVELGWLEQVHGNQVIDAQVSSSEPRTADAVYTDQALLACAVLTADCLPVLFSSKDGHEVAAAHAGWRGLVDGVLETTIKRFTQAPKNILAWLGPAIGPQAFEVGEDVRSAFIQQWGGRCPVNLIKRAFVAVDSAEAQRKYLADIYQLARLQLLSAGIENIYGGGMCTVTDQRFYSYRRDQVTGRMASVIVRHV